MVKRDINKVAYDGFKILIVDDEPSNLEVLSRILQSEYRSFHGIVQPNYRISIAKSGELALKRVVNDKPDLILLDIIMPGLNGFEVLTALKGSEYTSTIPVIIITGLDSVEDEEKGFYLGAVDYITKPFNQSLVKARVMTHLRIVEQMRIIERLGFLDPLTNLPNRRNFDAQMVIEWGRAARERTEVSFCMIDVDNFKMVNDTYGHQQGDMVLKVIGGIIRTSVKRPADFVARWGGEEFAVLLPGTDSEGALDVAETIRINIEKTLIPRLIGDSPLSVTVSVGVAAAMPFADSAMADLVKQADRALYAAKEAGKNRCVYKRTSSHVHEPDSL